MAATQHDFKWMLRESYHELARTVHPISGSIVTIFLFTRLWARALRGKGLWRDDYVLIAAWASLLLANGFSASSPAYGFNMLDGTSVGVTVHVVGFCFIYCAVSLSKTAFALTLLRLTSSRHAKGLLWVIMVLLNSFNSAMVVLSWLDICETRYDYANIPGRCVSMTTAMMIHIGNASVALVSDFVLAGYPWWIINRVSYISKREKWSVAASMGLVGMSFLVGVAKMSIMRLIPSKEHGDVDYTYGIVTLGCVYQAEAAVFIIAQTIPIIRVLLQADTPGESSVASGRSRPKTPMTNTRAPSIELVQLPGGRIVAVDSEEGRLYQSGQQQQPTQHTQPPSKGDEAGAEARRQAPVDDEIHRIWEQMGLSKRAWSKSPSPPGSPVTRQRMD